MAKQYYVGVPANEYGLTLPYEVFRSADEPTRETHGARYACTIGPFRTKRGAEFMARYGWGNPHCRCVAEAEKLAKRMAQGKL